ncbi:LysM peptidoglycan-binding domain-containing protein [Streptococcus tangpeifui]|uniref:LysM peptidoglycan-binding domain-containing protein n=1 Tax=Streptococcus tangpeifui TaxID=2709400 RepID=UPI0013EDBB1E|nr:MULTISPECIES: LysM domain-containing protein [unclassified Streptococcus]
MRKKEVLGCALMMSALVLPMSVEAKAAANSFYDNQTNAQRADITNWVASTPTQISQNMSSQKINVNHLDGERYIIQWGDTLWGISQATGISVQKLAYDNHIANVDLIYAGDILILKRDGQVPAEYHYKGSGHYVAQTSITINFSYQDNNTIVIVNNTSFYEDNHIEHTYPIVEKGRSTSSSEVEKNESSSNNQDNSTTSSAKKSAKVERGQSEKDETLDNETYQDAVQNELNALLDDGINFLPHNSGADTASRTNELEEEELYAQDQTVTVSDIASTNKGAKAVAQAIYEQLNKDGYLGNLVDAREVQLHIMQDGQSTISFNVSVYNESEESEESDDSSSSSSKDSEASDNSTDTDNYSSDSSQTDSPDSVTEFSEDD